jgi:pimeloyl-ACP methyl ester carboxylesterase
MLTGPGAAAVARAADQVKTDEGKFLIYMGETQIGTEEFRLDEKGAFSVVELSFMGTTSRAEVSLYGRPGAWTSYKLAAGPQTITAAIGEREVTVEVVGLKKTLTFDGPPTVVESNIFYHYQLMLDAYDRAAGGTQCQEVLIPSAMSSGEATIEIVGPVAEGTPIPLTEFRIVVTKVFGLTAFVDADGRMVELQFPAQQLRVVREDYDALARAHAQARKAESSAQGLPYTEEEFVVKNGDIELAGTLTIPAEGTGPYPAVFLNSGSGPQDRDGNTPPVFMTYMFRHMAERYASAGIAVMRYDERGVGKSTGSNEAALLSDLIGDVEALIAYLKAHPSIDRSRIVVLGHSEGGYIAPAVAAADPEIAGCIVIAGASTPLDQIMVEQVEYQASHEELDERSRALAASTMPMVKQLIQDAKDGKETSVVPSFNLDWLREHMIHDPIATIQKVRVPVLIIQGDKDLKVKPYHADVLGMALREAGNPDVTVVHLPMIGHEMMAWPYNNPDFDPHNPTKVPDEVYNTIGDWMVERLVTGR